MRFANLRMEKIRQGSPSALSLQPRCFHMKKVFLNRHQLVAILLHDCFRRYGTQGGCLSANALEYHGLGR